MTKKANSFYFAGIDIGRTTAKVVILDASGSLVFSRYYRHQGKTVETARGIFREALRDMEDVELDLAVTGSAGMGAAEAFMVPFVQEVVASADSSEPSFPRSGPLLKSAARIQKSYSSMTMAAPISE